MLSNGSPIYKPKNQIIALFIYKPKNFKLQVQFNYKMELCNLAITRTVLHLYVVLLGYKYESKRDLRWG